MSSNPSFLAMISLKQFDIFKAPATDLVESSAGGGGLTISAVLICVLIFCSELGPYWRGTILQQSLYSIKKCYLGNTINK